MSDFADAFEKAHQNDLLILRSISTRGWLQRFSDRLQPSDSGCLEWQGTKHPAGYGVIALPRSVARTAAGVSKTALVHRVSVIASTGQVIQPGMVVDHLCRNKLCAEVSHLEVVSDRVNWVRGASPTKANAMRTTCSRCGGPLEFARNSTPTNPKRRCKACDRSYALATSALVSQVAAAYGLTYRQAIARFGSGRAGLTEALNVREAS
jgi:hypothetical protein